MSTANEGCKHAMKGGPRRGSECGRPLHLGSTCWRHDDNTVSARNLRNRERTADKKVTETSAADREKYEDALYDEVANVTRRMKSVGGWGSEKHGEFHSLRDEWRNLISKISASQLRMTLGSYKRTSKKAKEYDPGGRYEKCPIEECDCMVDGKYPKVRGRVTSEFGHYFSDEDCSDGSDCEHEDVHDCEK